MTSPYETDDEGPAKGQLSVKQTGRDIRDRRDENHISNPVWIHSAGDIIFKSKDLPIHTPEFFSHCPWRGLQVHKQRYHGEDASCQREIHVEEPSVVHFGKSTTDWRTLETCRISY